MPLRIVNQMGPPAADAIRAEFPDAEIIELGPDGPPPGFTADVVFGGYGMWDTILEWVDAGGVRWVQLEGTGADKVPAALFERCTVTCARGASAVPIAEFVMGAILAFAKRLPDTWLSEPPKHWNFARLDVVHGRTLGLVGLGGIGQAIAVRALPFGMHVRALRRSAQPSPVDGVELVASLDDLLATTDHLVLAAPATPNTRHMMNADAFAQVKPGVHLVNIGRGALVDQDALRDALDDGRVAMASLDTVEPEPLPAGHWMYSHPRVRLSAHVSWYTPEMFARPVELFLENLRRFVRGEPLENVVDPDEGY